MLHMTGIDSFRLLKNRGYKSLDANKAHINEAISFAEKEVIKELDCHYSEALQTCQSKKWLDECAGKLPEGRVLAK